MHHLRRCLNHRQGIEVDRALFYMACPDFFPFLKLNLSAANEITLWWEIQMCGLTLGLLQRTILLIYRKTIRYNQKVIYFKK